MAKLYFRYGAMGSSKTANAIMVQYNYQERGQRALLMKPRLDNRDGADRVGSRSGLSARCRFVEDMDGMDLSQYNCIIVDEAQFLAKAQVEKLVSVVDDQNIPVICYGLRADFQGNLFEGSQWLLAWADTIEEVKTVCWCGRKATCNTRVVGGRVDQGRAADSSGGLGELRGPLPPALAAGRAGAAGDSQNQRRQVGIPGSSIGSGPGGSGGEPVSGRQRPVRAVCQRKSGKQNLPMAAAGRPFGNQKPGHPDRISGARDTPASSSTRRCADTAPISGGYMWARLLTASPFTKAAVFAGIMWRRTFS